MGSRRTRRRVRSPKVHYIGFGDVEKRVFFLFVFSASGLNLETADLVFGVENSAKGFPRTLAFGSKHQQGDAPLCSFLARKRASGRATDS